MSEVSTHFFLVATFGLISLVIPMLVARRNISQAYVMLALFLLLSALANGLPFLIELFPSVEHYSLAIVVPSYIMQPVCLWFYVKGLCANRPWSISKNHKAHLVLPAFSILYALAVTFVPGEEMEALFTGNESIQSTFTESIAIATFIFMLVWLLMSSVYLSFIFKRLVLYRRELKQLFATTDNQEMGWLYFVLSALAFAWIVSFIALMMGFAGTEDEVLNSMLPISYFLLVWLLSYWGLRQKPGFNDRYIQQDELAEVVDMVSTAETQQKYKRSGLDREKSERIAKKIDQAMNAKSLYLQADLSLSMLALEISEKPNYVSQALNQILGSSFFDYVNSFRIEYSKGLILRGELSILDIALASGFNAKSSFYKAFKKETGQTPKQFNSS